MTKSNTSSSRVTSKGQITIPKAVREKLGVKPGDEVDFVSENGSVIMRKHFDAEAFDAALRKWSGYLGDLKGRSVDDLIDEMRDG